MNFDRFQPPTETKPGRFIKCWACYGDGWCPEGGVRLEFQNEPFDGVEVCKHCGGTGEIDTADWED